jgi:ribose/xylose/arabinose/galactoside ABC-type transport system permease subunit
MVTLNKPILYSLIAGCLWAVIGLGIAWSVSAVRSSPSDVLRSFSGGLAAAPAIGLLVGLLARNFSRHGRTARVVVALANLYLAVWLFLLATSAASLVTGEVARSRGFETLVSGPVLGAFLGLTYTGFIVVLWPLSYLTHRVIGRAWNEAS